MSGNEPHDRFGGDVFLSMVTFSGSTNISYTNTTTDSDINIDIEMITEYQITLTIWKFCPPVLIVLGVFGNMATIAVLCKIRWKGSTIHHHLIGLALADLCLLLTGLLRQWIKFTFHMDVRDLHWLGCKLHIFLTYSAGTMSAWFLVFVSAQRTVAVVFPSHVTFFCSTRRSKVGLVAVILSAFTLSVPILKGAELRYGCHLIDHYSTHINPWIDMFISSLLPSLILASCNVILVWAVRRSVETKRGSLGSVISNIATRKRAVSSLTVTLIVISTAFLVLTLPVSLSLGIDSLMSMLREERNIFYAARVGLVVAVTSILWYTNSAINFLLYCLSGRKFRAVFLELFCRKAQANKSSDQLRPTQSLTQEELSINEEKGNNFK